MGGECVKKLSVFAPYISGLLHSFAMIMNSYFTHVIIKIKIGARLVK